MDAAQGRPPMPPRLCTLRSPLPPSLALAPVRSSFLGAYAESFPPLQRSHAEAPQPLLVLEEAAGAKRVQGVNYAYFGIRHQYLS
jgi:hypothetical protein